MRTSIDLPDSLLERARARAGADHTTISSVIAEALRHLLDEPDQAGRLPTFGADSEILIDLDDKDALQALFDEEDFGDLYRQRAGADQQGCQSPSE